MKTPQSEVERLEREIESLSQRLDELGPNDHEAASPLLRRLAFLEQHLEDIYAREGQNGHQ